MMARNPSQQQNGHEEDWKISLCNPGHGSDCLRAYFLPCVHFGRTRYRLDRIGQGEDALDMAEYTTCNVPCWKYCLLCVGGIYIGSGIYTGRERRRVRNNYGIAGTYLKDILNGVCCQPCTLIRNEAETRRRELDPGTERHDETAASSPTLTMGAQNYLPMDAFAASGQSQPLPQPVNEGYRPEPNMASEDRGQARRQSARREVEVHEPLQENSGPIADSAIPIYPSDEDINYTDHQLLGALNAGSFMAMDVLDRRNHALSAISERDSEDPRHRGSNPILAQLQDWIQDAAETVAERARAETGVVESGPGNSRGPRAREGPMVSVQDIDQTALSEPFAAAESTPPRPPAPEPLVGPKGRRRAISGPSVPQDPTRGLRVTIPSTSDLEGTPDDISPRSLARRIHDLSVDKQDEYFKVTDDEQNLGISKSVESVQLDDEKHELGRDQHTPGVDTVLDAPTADTTPGKQASKGRRLPKDIEAEALSSAADISDARSDVSLPTPKLVEPEEAKRRMAEYVTQRPQTSEHRLSMDRRVASAPPSGPLSHGIQFDKRVAAPELAYANLDHILKDRRIIPSTPGEHDLHADERVQSTTTLTPSEHDIGLDKRVAASPTGSAKRPGLGEDATAGSSSSQKPVTNDNKVAQRAYQLLEQFLGSEGRNRPATNRDPRTAASQ